MVVRQQIRRFPGRERFGEAEALGHIAVQLLEPCELLRGFHPLYDDPQTDGVREADVVTADGELLRVSAYEHPDLFWGLKGGGGNFGIVTSMEFAFHPLTTVYCGNLFYPVERTSGVRERQFQALG
jgi:hypothetical protein